MGYDPTSSNGGYQGDGQNNSYQGDGQNNGYQNNGQNNGYQNNGQSRSNERESNPPICSAWRGRNQQGDEYIHIQFKGTGGLPEGQLYLNLSKNKKSDKHPDFYGFELRELKKRDNGSGSNYRNNNNNNNNNNNY